MNGEKAVIDVIGEEIEVNNYGEKVAGEEASLVLRPEAVVLSERDFWKERLSCQHSWVPISIIR